MNTKTQELFGKIKERFSWKNMLSWKNLLFLVLFVALVFVGNKINFSSVVGMDKQYFTLFQFFGPIAGAFLGPIFGVASVLLTQGTDFLLANKEWTIINLLRLLPMLFAAYYFSTKKKSWGIIIPAVCMLLFLMHPIGRQAWFITLYWIIPILGKVLPEKWGSTLTFRSLGATFTAHAIGTTLWIWTVPMTLEQWVGLMPIIAYERILFAAGIVVSYVAINSLLDYIVDKWKLNLRSVFLHIKPEYTFRNMLARKKWF